MTVQELFDYITTKMTPEEALKKMLQAGIGNYKKLKFNKGEEIHPVILISMATMDLGWDFLIENEEKSKDVRGMIIGTKEYMDSLKYYKETPIKEDQS